MTLKKKNRVFKTNINKSKKNKKSNKKSNKKKKFSKKGGYFKRGKVSYSFDKLDAKVIYKVDETEKSYILFKNKTDEESLQQLTFLKEERNKKIIEVIKEIKEFLEEKNNPISKFFSSIYLYYSDGIPILRKQFDPFKVLKGIIEMYVQLNCQQSPDDWCQDASFREFLQNLVTAELTSTYYFLTLIWRSTIITPKDGVEQSQPITFEIEGEGELTGTWEDDKNRLKIVLNTDENLQSSIIFGLGPSASGKTFWAKKILKYLNNPSDRYFTIDGGIFRENSLIYQLLRESFFQYNKGHASLVDVIHPSQSFFLDKDCKKELKTFFKENTGLSFYIPTTSLFVEESAKDGMYHWNFSKILIDEAKEFKITEGNILCVLIFQCLNSCKYSKLTNFNLRCSGCQLLGTEREIDEGKKYSSKAYIPSFLIHDKIYKSFKLHDLNCLKIHNSKDGYSIIEMSNDTPLIGTFEDLKRRTEDDKCIIVRDMEDNQALNEEYQSKVQSEKPPASGKIEEYKPEFFLFKTESSSLYGIYFNMTEHKNKLIRFNSSVPKVEIINGEGELKDDLRLKENLDKVKEKMKGPLVPQDKKGIILKSIDEEGKRAFNPLRGMGLYVLLNFLLDSSISKEENKLIKQTDLVEILNNSQKEPYKIPQGKYNFESPEKVAKRPTEGNLTTRDLARKRARLFRAKRV